MVIAPLLAIALQASPAPPIVVTGERAKAAHESCLRRQCTPEEDANASIAFAEQRFMRGEYAAARKILRGALRRQKHAAATHPAAVSALYSAHATVSLHFGEEQDYRRSGLSAIGVVQRAYGPDDSRSIAATAYAGDVDWQSGRFLSADRAYRSAVEKARAAKLDLLGDALEVRRAALLAGLPGRASKPAERLLIRFADDAAVDRRVRIQAAVFAARAARKRGDARLEQRMLALIGEGDGKAAPTLISAPPVATGSRATALAEARRWGESLEPSSGDALAWADIGFWVRPDGAVADAEVIRGTRARQWVAPILQAILGRRYAPYPAEAGDPGRYRVERFTRAARFATGKGSRIRARVGEPQLRALDVTEATKEEVAPPPPSP